MRTLLIILVLALAVVGVLFALGFFDEEVEAPTPGGLPTGPSTPVEEESALLTGASPAEEPDIEELPLIDPLQVLMLAGVPERLNLFLARSMATHPKIDVHTWAPTLNLPEVPPPSTLPGALQGPPTDSIFRDEDIDVLIVHDFDPALLDDAFWRAVDERVRSGRLGLYVQPGMKHGAAMLDHPILSALLPVAEVAPLEGTPVPGVFGRLVPFEVTEEGETHPATKLVPWPRWSKTLWAARTTGEFPWGTSFSYPVTALRDGALVLLKSQPPRQPDSIPSFIVGAADGGRVIFNGAWELGSRQAYGQPRIADEWTKLVRNWMIYLGGRDL